MPLSGHLLRHVGIGPPCFSFIKYLFGAVSIEKDMYLIPAHSLKTTSSSHSAQYCIYQTYSDALKDSFFPQLFYSGVVIHLRWSIPRLLRSLGHSSFSQKHVAKRFFIFCYIFFSLKISKFALPGIMIEFNRASITR